MKNNITNALLSLLNKGIVRFTYRKVDGSIREAVGTCNLDIARDALAICIPNPKTGRTNPTAYYDLEKEDWRSFKAENVIAINGINIKDIKGVRGSRIVKVDEPIAVEIPINCDDSEVIPIGSANDIDFGGKGVGIPIGYCSGVSVLPKSENKPIGGTPIEKGEPKNFDLGKVGKMLGVSFGKVGTPIATEKGISLPMEIGVEDFAKMVAHYVVEELIGRIK